MQTKIIMQAHSEERNLTNQVAVHLDRLYIRLMVLIFIGRNESLQLIDALKVEGICEERRTDIRRQIFLISR